MEPIPRYRLGPYLLEPATRTLSTDGGLEVHLAQKPFLVLVHLVENRHRLVTRAELLERFWSGGDVYDQALTRCLSSIRKSLDDQSDPARFIETRWAEGYRYIGPCEIDVATATGPVPTVASNALAGGSATGTAPAAAVPATAIAAGAPPPRWPAWKLAIGLALAFVGGAIGWRITTAPDLDGVRRIAVVTSFSGGADDAWMRDALPRQVIALVARTEGLEFVTGDAAIQGPVDAALNVDLVLDAEQLAIHARLSARDGRPLWTYEGSSSRAEMMKAERHLLRALAARFELPVHEPPPRARSEGSYLHLVRGFELLEDRECGAASLAQALAEFGATLDADPGYPEALAGQAEAELATGWCEAKIDPAAAVRARTLAESAARFDPGSARAQRVLGAVAISEQDWATAQAHLDRAIELAPGDARTRRVRAIAYCAQLQSIECLREAAYAAALAPDSTLAALAHVRALAQAGRTEAAIAVNDAARQRWPQDPRFAALGEALRHPSGL